MQFFRALTQLQMLQIRSVEGKKKTRKQPLLRRTYKLRDCGIKSPYTQCKITLKYIYIYIHVQNNKNTTWTWKLTVLTLLTLKELFQSRKLSPKSDCAIHEFLTALYKLWILKHELTLKQNTVSWIDDALFLQNSPFCWQHTKWRENRRSFFFVSKQCGAIAFWLHNHLQSCAKV